VKKLHRIKYSYLLHIQKGNGPEMYWTGERFSNDKKTPLHYFDKAATARREGKKLLARFPLLKGYKIWVAPITHFAKPVNGKKQRAMRGGSKAPKANPSAREHAQLDVAAKKLEDFTGHRVGNLQSAHSRSSQSTGLIIGELDLVGYRATRDGKTERYGHHFKKHSRPLLAVTSDGKQLHIVGGQYEFTEAGIEDR
jgi:hypothetical protein